ncbi:endonuclease/exonuclease/phosphatase family protein [Paracoccus sp. (in: a-proteobacteria)]|uniref:endonuclease/exonuclease/phosphatase family protein n=1 Tax=Paracoccus sp. TaxID=267 RepID=UPI0028A0E26F|nr:endonuclease/exonuclease/phosphatase family protein [Paracoccus sp. (in: a-proteobacteria)]
MAAKAKHARHRTREGGLGKAAFWVALPVLILCAPMVARAEPLRIATFASDLSRKGPGLLYRDLLSGKDAQITAVIEVITHARPDVLLLTGIDWDYDNLALKALADQLASAGLDYPYLHASRPNSGMPTRLDLDLNGKFGEARDAQGYGNFSGEGGMALLSRHPLGTPTDHSATLWRDMPGHIMPPTTPEHGAVQRLSSVAHWQVPVLISGKPLQLLAYAATPPVFDGPEDRNGRRNHDETAFWLQHLPQEAFVILGNANLDMIDGDGRPEALTALIKAHVQDPRPASPGGAAYPQTGSNARHKGDPALDTANWPADGAGNMRVDYVLPAIGLPVLDAGVVWPVDGDALAPSVQAASRHRLVWVDLDWP